MSERVCYSHLEMEGESNMDETKPRTDFLFARSSFLSGVARVLDMFGTFDRYNVSRTPEEADAHAIASDWQMVGYDMRTAMQQESARVALASRAKGTAEHKLVVQR